MTWTKKLIGDEEERAVSPVIGVILMVAITVILAAVIAAFVLDMGSGMEENANAGVEFNVDNNANEIEISSSTMGNAERIVFRGDTSTDKEIKNVGEPITLTNNGDEDDLNSREGTITAVAITDDGSETTISSQDYEFNPEVEFEEDTTANTVTVTVTDWGVADEMDVSSDSESETIAQLSDDGDSATVDVTDEETVTVTDDLDVEVATYDYSTSG